MEREHEDDSEEGEREGHEEEPRIDLGGESEGFEAFGEADCESEEESEAGRREEIADRGTAVMQIRRGTGPPARGRRRLPDRPGSPLSR